MCAGVADARRTMKLAMRGLGCNLGVDSMSQAWCSLEEKLLEIIERRKTFLQI